MPDMDKDRIVKTVDLKAPVARVWKALTDYKEFGTWFRVDLDQPFEAGGKSTGRITYPGHEGIPWVAYIDCMEPERLFSFRWYDTEDGSSGPNGEAPALLVTFELSETTEGTHLTITESGFAALPEARRIELMRGNEEGWTIQAGHIAQYLSA